MFAIGSLLPIARWKLTVDHSLTPAQLAFLERALPGFSTEAWEITLAGQAASQRYFLRVKKRNGSESRILVVWDAKDEDWPRFLAIPAELSSLSHCLPAIFESDPRHGLILEEDLGDMTLCRFCREPSTDDAAIEVAYRAALDELCIWQSFPPEASEAISSRAMDLDTFLWETDYFARRCVVDFFGNEKLLTKAWEQERRAMALAASSLPRTFIHRDFQSENILLAKGKIRFVDFQGARLGPPAYDVASLLFDPYVEALDEPYVNRLFEYYTQRRGLNSDDAHSFYLCAAQRLMQALGAYGNLSVHKGKERYRAFVPTALRRLDTVMEKLPEYPEIRYVVSTCLKSIGRE
jgi:N-acetylmuramate 1-kinase